MKKRITIDDIAKLSGVSKSTVSRVLNNSPGVKEKKKKKVLEIVKKYDYIPNIIASGLVKKRINTLGVIVSDITNPYYSVLVKGIEDICRAYGYGLLLCNTDGRVIEEVKHVKKIVQVTHMPPFKTKLDVVYTGAHVGSEVVRKFIEEYKPLVAISAHIHEARGIDEIGKTKLINSGRFPEGYCGLVSINEEVNARIINLI